MSKPADVCNCADEALDKLLSDAAAWEISFESLPDVVLPTAAESAAEVEQLLAEVSKPLCCGNCCLPLF